MIQWRLARYIICSPGIKFSSTYPIGSSSKPNDEKGTGYFSRFSKDQSSFQNQQKRKVACPLFTARISSWRGNIPQNDFRKDPRKRRRSNRFPRVGEFHERGRRCSALQHEQQSQPAYQPRWCCPPRTQRGTRWPHAAAIL